MAPNALTLVLDPSDQHDVAEVARELGATLVLAGTVVPPEVERLLQRWLPIARARSDAEGWSASAEPEPEPWDDPELFRWPGQASPIDETNPVAPTKDSV